MVLAPETDTRPDREELPRAVFQPEREAPHPARAREIREPLAEVACGRHLAVEYFLHPLDFFQLDLNAHPERRRERRGERPARRRFPRDCMLERIPLGAVHRIIEVHPSQSVHLPDVPVPAERADISDADGCHKEFIQLGGESEVHADPAPRGRWERGTSEIGLRSHARHVDIRIKHAVAPRREPRVVARDRRVGEPVDQFYGETRRPAPEHGDVGESESGGESVLTRPGGRSRGAAEVVCRSGCHSFEEKSRVRRWNRRTRRHAFCRRERKCRESSETERQPDGADLRIGADPSGPPRERVQQLLLVRLREIPRDPAGR